MARNKRGRGFSFRKWYKKIKTERSLIRLILICIAFLAACILIATFHVNRIFQVFEETSYNYIINRSELTSRYFSENFQRRGSLVLAEAQVLSENDTIDKSSICNCLKVLEETGEFSYARYISSRGIKYRSDGALNSTMLTMYTFT